MVNSLTMKILVGAILLKCKLLNGQIIFDGKIINTIKPNLTEEDILSPPLITRIANSDGPGTLPQQVIIRVSPNMTLI